MSGKGGKWDWKRYTGGFNYIWNAFFPLMFYCNLLIFFISSEAICMAMRWVIFVKGPDYGRGMGIERKTVQRWSQQSLGSHQMWAIREKEESKMTWETQNLKGELADTVKNTGGRQAGGWQNWQVGFEGSMHHSGTVFRQKCRPNLGKGVN